LNTPLSEDAQRLRIGAFELRLATRELLREGEPVELQPKVFDFIAFLVRNRHRAVDKDELLDAVWPRQVVTETALTRCVMKARRALDDDAEAQRAIRTVHSRGYRFVAEVELLSEVREPAQANDAGRDIAPATAALEGIPGEPAPAADTRAPEATATGFRLHARPFLLFTLLAAVLLAAWQWLPPLLAPAAMTTKPRIAVLPVRNATGDPRYDWVRLGLAAASTDFLLQSQVGAVPPLDTLRLLEATGMEEMDGAEAEARAARALWQAHGASHTVAATLESSGGRLRLRYRVLDREGGVRRRSVVAPDASGLATLLGADLVAQFGHRHLPEASGDAFVNEAYLRARALSLAGDYERAIELLDVAIAQAPDAFWPRYEYALILRNQRQFDLAEPLMRSLIEQARAEEDVVGEEYALNSLAILRWQREDLDEAESLFGRALAIARERGDFATQGKILQNASVIPRIRRQYERSREMLMQALDAFVRAGFENPPPPVFMALGNQAQADGDFATAEQHYQRSETGYRLLGGGNAVGYAIYNRARVQMQLGRWDQSRALLQSALAELEASGDKGGAVGVLNSQAEIALLLEERDAAERLARAAVERADAQERDMPRAYTRRTLGLTLLAADRFADADSVFGQSQAYYRTARFEEGWQQVELHRAEVLLAQGDWAGARARAGAVLHQAEALSLQRNAAEAEAVLARAALRAGGTAEALALWQATLGRFERELPGEAQRLAERRLQSVPAWIAAGQAEEARRQLELAAPVLADSPAWHRARALLAPGDSP
jgi:DNA-binding winged helix-turn-helix (wHTH) protein/tetratricopeptide (TPR) repeat protein